MFKEFCKPYKSQKGGIWEYVLLISLILLIGIASVKFLGQKMNVVFCAKVASELGQSGGSGDAPRDACAATVQAEPTPVVNN